SGSMAYIGSHHLSIFLVIFALQAVDYLLLHLRIRSLLRNWTDENNFKVLRLRRCSGFVLYPFGWMVGVKPLGYDVRLRDDQGRERHARMRFVPSLLNVVPAGPEDIEWGPQPRLQPGMMMKIILVVFVISVFLILLFR